MKSVIILKNSSYYLFKISILFVILGRAVLEILTYNVYAPVSALPGFTLAPTSTPAGPVHGVT